MARVTITPRADALRPAGVGGALDAEGRNIQGATMIPPASLCISRRMVTVSSTLAPNSSSRCLGIPCQFPNVAQLVTQLRSEAADQ